MAPSWPVDLKRGVELLKLSIRGVRQSDVVLFTELKREADILQILGEQGIPVPKVYGMCEDPVAIIMEAVPGTRDVSCASSDTEQRSVARQYIEAMVAMHRLPHYQKHKSMSDPLIEFAMRWHYQNVPELRTEASFIAFDTGQFLFDQGWVTALSDHGHEALLRANR